MVSASQILNASILVVDDQEANVTLLGRMLLGAGYTSVSSTRNAAGGGRAAIARLLAKRWPSWRRQTDSWLYRRRPQAPVDVVTTKVPILLAEVSGLLESD